MENEDYKDRVFVPYFTKSICQNYMHATGIPVFYLQKEKLEKFLITWCKEVSDSYGLKGAEK